MFIHESSPNSRHMKQICAHLNAGGIVAAPSSTGYCLLIQTTDRRALERVRRLRQLDKHHLFTLICEDLSVISKKAILDDRCYKLMKKHIPSPCTFILRASKSISKEILHPKRRTIGIRVPKEPILMSLLKSFDAPLLSVSLEQHAATSIALTADEVENMVGDQALVLDVGRPCPVDLSTIVDCTEHPFTIMRQGQYWVEL